jgi:hypothetical protein
MGFEGWNPAAIRERWLARSVARRLLRSHAAVTLAHPGLAGRDLYRAILSRSGLVGSGEVEETLKLAEDSVDEWTAPQRTGLGLRELAHFLIMALHRARGHSGAIVSFGAIVEALIPPHL